MSVVDRDGSRVLKHFTKLSDVSSESGAVFGLIAILEFTGWR